MTIAPDRYAADDWYGRVRAPSQRARFEQILNRHHRRLRRVVAGVIADPDRVDDVLQEAYIKAYRRLPGTFANEAHEAAWLYRVVYRCSLDEVRRRRRGRERATGELHLHEALEGEPIGAIAVEDALRRLSAADRAVLLLVGVLGLPYEDAATIMDVPRGTLAWRLREARGRFRRALEGEP